MLETSLAGSAPRFPCQEQSHLIVCQRLVMMKTCSLGYCEIILLTHYYSCSSLLTLILLSCKRILRGDIQLASQATV